MMTSTTRRCLLTAVTKTIAYLIADDALVREPGESPVTEYDRYIAAFEMLRKTATEKVLEYKRQRNKTLPLHRLPTELVVEIVREVLREKNDHTYYRFLLPLRLFCAQWASIINSTPSLWRLLPIWNQPRLQLTNLILQVSGQVPLDIIVFGEDPRSLRRSYDAALRHSERWRSLAIEGYAADWEGTRILPGPMPILRELRVKLHPGAGTTATQAFNLEWLPELRDLALENVSLQWDDFLPTRLLRLELVEFDVHRLPLDHLYHILRSSSSLTTLIVDNCDTDPPPQTSRFHHPRLFLPHLTEIQLRNLGPAVLSWFVDIVPPQDPERCRVVQVACDVHNAIATVDIVSRWLDSTLSASAQSTCEIHDIYMFKFEKGATKLEIRTHPLTAEERMEFYRQVNHLIRTSETKLIMSLHDHTIASEISALVHGALSWSANVTSLEIEGRNTVLFPTILPSLGRPAVDQRWPYPALRELAISTILSKEEQADVIVNLVQSRWAGGTRLERAEPPVPLLVLRIKEVAAPISSFLVEPLRSLLPSTSLHIEEYDNDN